MIHPDTKLQFISKEIGYGVVATKLIPKGTITWVYDLLDRTFAAWKVAEMDKVYRDILDRYSYRDQKGDHVLCWDNSRFINHSFNSNCISTAYNFELAIRDIHVGEEVTDDYGYLNCQAPFECMPELNSSRLHVMPDDLLHYYKEWDSKLLSAFELVNQVEQPLMLLIKPHYREKLSSIANGGEEMDSILTTFYNEDQALMAKKKALLSRRYSLRAVTEKV